MSWFDKHESNSSGRPGRAMAMAAVVVLAGTVVAGCSDDDDTATTGADTAETTEAVGAIETDETTETEDTAADGGGSSAQDQVMVDIVDISEAFQPTTVTVAAGGEVTWVNSDDIPHTTTADDGTWDSGQLEGGEEFTFTAEEPGTYPYICTIHPTMKGEVIVE